MRHGVTIAGFRTALGGLPDLTARAGRVAVAMTMIGALGVVGVLVSAPAASA